MFNSTEWIREAKTSALITFYNANVPADSAVKKFRDRATAEAKAAAIFEAKKGEAKVKEVAKALDWIDTPEAVVAALPTGIHPESVAEQIEVGAWPWPKAADFATAKKAAPVPSVRSVARAKAEPEKAGNAQGVASSWANVKVREARLTRHGVKVTFNGVTTEYRSVREAFRENRLPDAKHIKFRGQLKASGRESFEFKGKLYLFALCDFEEPSDSIRI